MSFFSFAGWQADAIHRRIHREWRNDWAAFLVGVNYFLRPLLLVLGIVPNTRIETSAEKRGYAHIKQKWRVGYLIHLFATSSRRSSINILFRGRRQAAANSITYQVFKFTFFVLFRYWSQRKMFETRLITVVLMLFLLVCFNIELSFGEHQQQQMNTGNDILGNKSNLTNEDRDAKCT